MYSAGTKSKITKVAEKAGVMIVMELLNSKIDHRGYQGDNTEWGMALVDKVGSDHFKLLYDIYHMEIMEGHVIDTIKQHHSYFAHYHTGGVPGRNEIDDSQTLDYPAICRTITATGFEGYLGQEFIPTRDPLEGLTQAVKLCDV